jgi:hypothetical protein
VRIAAFDVENLFDRAKALNQKTWAQGKPVLEKHARLNDLLNLPVYSPDDKAEIRKLLIEFGLRKRDDAGKWGGVAPESRQARTTSEGRRSRGSRQRP